MAQPAIGGGSWPRRLTRTDPERMTTRARVLVLIVAFRNFALGACLLATPGRFTSISYDVIRSLPWPVWAWMMLATGVACAAAAISMDELTARVGVGASATISLVWAAGFGMAVCGTGASPAGVIVWASLAAKDFLIVSYPMASPFEPIIRRVFRVLDLDSAGDGDVVGDMPPPRKR